MVAAGLATHLVPAHRLEELREGLFSLGSGAGHTTAISSLLSSLEVSDVVLVCHCCLQCGCCLECWTCRGMPLLLNDCTQADSRDLQPQLRVETISVT